MGVRELSNELRKLVVMNAICLILFIYIGIFVNLYIWEKGHKIAELSLYNLATFLSWGAAFIVGAKLLARFTIRLLVLISAAGGALAFLYLMTVQLDNRTLWIILLGIPVGVMFGATSAVSNLGVALQGKRDEFAPYFATMNVIGQVLSIAVPIASAAVIDGFGYGASFVLMLLFLAIMLGYSYLLPKITLPQPVGPDRAEQFGKFRFSYAFSFPGSKWILLTLLASGIFLQFQNLFTLLFTFSVTQNHLLIALLNTFYTLSTLLAVWMYRRIRINENRWLWIGTLFLAVGLVILVIPSPVTLITSNVLTSIGMFYFSTVWNAQQFRCIEKLEPERQTAFIVWRECLLIVTRCVLLSLTLSLKELQGAWFIFIIALTLACCFAIPFFLQRAVRRNGETPSFEV